MGNISLPSAAQKKLKEMVGKRTVHYCPKCGAAMIIRQNSKDHSFFLGCSEYPECKGTEEIDESLYMEVIGHPTFW